MKVYRLEIMVIDFDGVGREGIISTIEDARYPNHCIAPSVKAVDERDIEWSDDHPLNKRATADQAYAELFKMENP